jgi:hypothetical protein
MGKVHQCGTIFRNRNFASMKRILCSFALTFSFSFFCLGQVIPANPDCNKDVKDSRGKMKPWKKGAWETGKYRNVFLDAGYSQAEIDAKLAKAYHDILLYLFSLMHLSGNYRIITPGMK